jgi:hypothetical protein
MSKKTKPQLVIDHLMRLGRITDATARAAYGAFQLNHAIWELRHKKTHLIPPGMEIITMDRFDVAGNRFAEFRLVQKGLPRFLATKPAYGAVNAA